MPYDQNLGARLAQPQGNPIGSVLGGIDAGMQRGQVMRGIQAQNALAGAPQGIAGMVGGQMTPKDALKQIAAQDPQGFTQIKDHVGQQIGAVLPQLGAMSPEDRAKTIAGLAQNDPFVAAFTSEMGETIDDDELAQAGMMFGQYLPKRPDPVIVGAGEALVDPSTGQPIAFNPKPPGSKVVGNALVSDSGEVLYEGTDSKGRNIQVFANGRSMDLDTGEQIRAPDTESQDTLKAVGGALYDTNTKEWITPPEMDSKKKYAKVETDEGVFMVNESNPEDSFKLGGSPQKGKAWSAPKAGMNPATGAPGFFQLNETTGDMRWLDAAPVPSGMDIEVDPATGAVRVRSGTNTTLSTQAKLEQSVISTEKSIDLLDRILSGEEDLPPGYAWGTTGMALDAVASVVEQMGGDAVTPITKLLSPDSRQRLVSQMSTLEGRVMPFITGETGRYTESERMMVREAFSSIKQGNATKRKFIEAMRTIRPYMQDYLDTERIRLEKGIGDKTAEIERAAAALDDL